MAPSSPWVSGLAVSVSALVLAGRQHSRLRGMSGRDSSRTMSKQAAPSSPLKSEVSKVGNSAKLCEATERREAGSARYL